MENNRIKSYFKKLTPEQVFSLCLFVGCFIIMLFCAIVRLCGGLWFSADLSIIKLPSKLWQDIIMALLLIFELSFVYKILCRSNWFVCIFIIIIQATIGYFIPNLLWTNLFHLFCYMIIPIFFVRNWFSLIDSIFLYLLTLLYSLLFLVGRIGNLNLDSASNFIYNVLGCIDYKLFIVSIYLYIKNFGGIKLWKNQKRLILKVDQKKKEM